MLPPDVELLPFTWCWQWGVPLFGNSPWHLSWCVGMWVCVCVRERERERVFWNSSTHYRATQITLEQHKHMTAAFIHSVRYGVDSINHLQHSVVQDRSSLHILWNIKQSWLFSFAVCYFTFYTSTKTDLLYRIITLIQIRTFPSCSKTASASIFFKNDLNRKCAQCGACFYFF